MTTKWVVNDSDEMVFDFFHQAEDYVEEFLNDAYADVEIAGMVYLAGDILRKVDPVAFNEILWDLISEQAIES